MSVSETHQDGQLTRSRFAMAPMPLVAQCKKRKGTLFVYLWLWDYAGAEDAAWPSVERQAVECGMKPDDVREARKWLCDSGWIQRRERPGETPVFHVRTERLFKRVSGETASAALTPPSNGEPLPKTGEPTPPPNGGTKQEPMNKKEEPPLVPRSQPAQPELHSGFLETWNAHAPEHWPRLREIGPGRGRRINGLAREFGSAAAALEALRVSLQEARNHAWAMAQTARLTPENWLSNGKVRQYAELAADQQQRQEATLPSHIAEIAAAAKGYSDWFSTEYREGALWIVFTPAVQAAASYPQRAQLASLEALEAEIGFLRGKMLLASAEAPAEAAEADLPLSPFLV